MAGPWAISPTVYLAFSPLLAYSVWARIDATEAVLTPARSLIIALAAVTISVLGFAALSRWIRPVRSSARASAICAQAVWIGAAIITSLAATTGKVLLGVAHPFALSGLVLMVVFIVLSMAIASFGLGALTERRAQLRRLRGRRRELGRLQDDATAFAREQRTALLQAIDTVVAPELDRLRQQVVRLGDQASDATVRELQESVSSYSVGLVRAISHQFVEGNDGRHTGSLRAHSTIRELTGLMTSARLGAPIIAFMTVLLALAQFRPNCTLELVFALAVFVVIESLAALIATWRLLRRSSVSFLWLVLSACIGFLGFKLTLARSAERCDWAASSAPFMAGTVFASATLIILAGVIQANAEVQEAIREVDLTNARLIEATRLLRAEGVLTRDEIFQWLHGPVQGRLSAVSIALQLHLHEVEEGRQPSLTILQQRVSHLLDEAAAELHRLLDRAPPQTEGLLDVITREREQWRGLMRLTDAFTQEALRAVEASAALSVLAGESIEEAVTNAGRHGRARSVRIEVSVAGAARAQLVLEVDDDGVGIPPDVEPGFGLRRISLNGGTWALEPKAGGGTRLTIRLPCAPS